MALAVAFRTARPGADLQALDAAIVHCRPSRGRPCGGPAGCNTSPAITRSVIPPPGRGSDMGSAFLGEMVGTCLVVLVVLGTATVESTRDNMCIGAGDRFAILALGAAGRRGAVERMLQPRRRPARLCVGLESCRRVDLLGDTTHAPALSASRAPVCLLRRRSRRGPAACQAGLVLLDEGVLLWRNSGIRVKSSGRNTTVCEGRRARARRHVGVERRDRPRSKRSPPHLVMGFPWHMYARMQAKKGQFCEGIYIYRAYGTTRRVEREEGGAFE